MKKGYDTAPLSRVQEKAFLIGVSLPGGSVAREKEYLEELEQLAVTAGADVVGKTVQARTRLDGATFIGRGKAENIKSSCEELGANLLIFNSDLSPAQARNLEKIFNINVIDRTELILDIFANHAKTRQAKIQVELAQLNYMLPRLRRLWDHLSRQAGGIGTRGPGETQLELDRRRISARVIHLRKQLKRIENRKNVVRRSRREFPVVAIIGYTNAGKSTLMNALTGARSLVRDRLFATLDTTTRKLKMVSDGHGPILIVDTVGFLRKLPHHLIESFRATLEDVSQAELYLHVVDVSHPMFPEQMEVTDTTVGTIDNPGVRTLHIFNKIDKVEQGLIKGLKRRYPDAFLISASQDIGIEALKERIGEFFNANRLRVEVELPTTDGKSIAAAKSLMKETDENFSDGTCILTGLVKTGDAERLAKISNAKIRYIR